MPRRADHPFLMTVELGVSFRSLLFPFELTQVSALLVFVIRYSDRMVGFVGEDINNFLAEFAVGAFIDGPDYLGSDDGLETEDFKLGDKGTGG